MRLTPKTATALISTPVGTLRAMADDAGLFVLDFVERTLPTGWAADAITSAGDDHPILAQAASELTEYFAGERQQFTIPLSPRGTAFEQRVWAALRPIPFGQTRSYSAQARAIGAPNASRAVGAANGRNRLAIVIPCHRVIGANGSLTGYGGGIDRKKWLLEHEAAVIGRGCGGATCDRGLFASVEAV